MFHLRLISFFIHLDFIVLDMEEDMRTAIILGRPFLACGSHYRCEEWKVGIASRGRASYFNLFDTSTHPAIIYSCLQIDVTKWCEKEMLKHHFKN